MQEIAQMGCHLEGIISLKDIFNKGLDQIEKKHKTL